MKLPKPFLLIIVLIKFNLFCIYSDSNNIRYFTLEDSKNIEVMVSPLDENLFWISSIDGKWYEFDTLNCKWSKLCRFDDFLSGRRIEFTIDKHNPDTLWIFNPVKGFMAFDTSSNNSEIISKDDFCQKTSISSYVIDTDYIWVGLGNGLVQINKETLLFHSGEKLNNFK